MERKEKGVGGDSSKESKEEKKKQEGLKIEKEIKRGMMLVGKRGGPSTPSPTWRLQFSPPSPSSPNNNKNRANPIQEFPNTTTTALSARKLCANLWEIEPQPFHPSVSKMSKNTGGRARRGHSRDKKETALELLVDPDQPESGSTLRKHFASSQMPHHPPLEKDCHALGPQSPASYGSSMEVAPYKPAVTPTSSLDFKGRMGESSYRLKTSTELLKVLNRIWNLEEQQTSNISLLKALKMELDLSRSQIKQLVKEKQASRQELDELMKQIAEDKVARKNKEQDRIRAAVVSLREELEDEMKLRRHSESLHRKLARDLSESKYAFSNSLKELERERKARSLLENLCDEFAKGITEYEQEVRSLRNKSEMDCVGDEKPERLVLHISEAWLDERMQMKIAEACNDISEKDTIVDKFGLDIETFLQARHSATRSRILSANEAINNCVRRESFPINEVTSAPRDAADEGDSSDSDSHCFELDKNVGEKLFLSGSKQRSDNTLILSSSKQRSDNTLILSSSKQRSDNASESHLEKLTHSNSLKGVAGIRESCKVHMQAGLAEKFEEVRNMSPDRELADLRRENQVAISKLGTPDIYEISRDLSERKGESVGSHGRRFKSDFVLDSLIRNHSRSSEGDLQEDFRHPVPAFTGLASPVQQWMSKLTNPEFDNSKSPLRLSKKRVKENTLKEKLIEARLEGVQRSRVRASSRISI